MTEYYVFERNDGSQVPCKVKKDKMVIRLVWNAKQRKSCGYVH